MDSPGHASVKRRGRLPHSSNISLPSKKCTPDASPSPFSSSVKSQEDGETGFPFPRATQTLSVGWKDGEDKASRDGSTMHIELAECVETKTVTTTTTTKRSYPPLRVRQRPLSSLDSKEYPLALKATPPELADLSFKYEDQLMDLFEDDYHPPGQEVRQHISPLSAAGVHYTNFPSRLYLPKIANAPPYAAISKARIYLEASRLSALRIS
jgi:F-box and WD-40 domain protein CDC4